MYAHRLIVASSLVLVVVACSGAKESDLLSPVSSGASSEPASAEPTADGETGTGTGTGGGSGSGTGTGGGTGGGTGTKDAGVDSGAGVDAGPPPSTETIPCGQANGNVLTCNVGTQVCCATFSDTGKTTFACKPAGANACGTSVKITCNGESDCPTDQICCGLLSQVTGYSSIECRSSCNSGPGVRAVHFCDPAALVDECIGYGGTCIKSQSVPGYHVCG